MRRLPKLLLPLAILAAGIAGFALLVQTRPQVPQGAPEVRVWTVAAAPVSLGSAQPQLQLYGEIVAGREVELRALVAGEIVAVGTALREGAPVAADELIVQIDPFEYEAALEERRAQLKEARAGLAQLQAQREAQQATLRRERQQYVLLERDVTRQRQLKRSGSIAQKTLDTAELELTRAGQRVNVAESTLAGDAARIEQQEAAIARMEVGVRRAERDLENARLVAPFAGFLTDIQAQEGKRVGVNDRIANLIDSDWLEARISLSDDQFGRLLGGAGLIGRQAEVIWHAGEGERRFDAVVERQAGRIDAAVGGVTIFARLPDLAPDTPLRPGAFVEVRMPDRQFENVAVLPEAALFEGDRVYVIGDDDRLQARQVELGARDGTDLLLRGALQDGERVLVTRFATAGPGVKVRLRTAAEDGQAATGATDGGATDGGATDGGATGGGPADGGAAAEGEAG